MDMNLLFIRRDYEHNPRNEVTSKSSTKDRFCRRLLNENLTAFGI